MNPLDWLKSVRENGGKWPFPPVPLEGVDSKKPVNTLIPPVTPCSSLYLNGNGELLPEGTGEGNSYCEGKGTETSGGHRGNGPFLRVESGLGLRVAQGEQGKNPVSATPARPVDPVTGLPQPFLTADGTLSIPFDSDPKYHWWKGGQSVKATMAEVKARMEGERKDTNEDPV